jgi:IS605 OrfB family transposase
LIPALKNNEEECPKGFHLNKKGNKCRYSLNEKLYDYLKKRSELWNSESPSIVGKFGILELIMTHRKHSPRACFPIVNETDLHRFQYVLGSNFVGYKMTSKSGEGLDDITFNTNAKDRGANVKFINGVSTNRPHISFRNHEFEIYISKLQGNVKHPNSYFKTFSFWNEFKEKKPHDRNTTLVSFERKNGNVFYGLAKEPAIVSKKGNFYIRLNLTVFHQDGADIGERDSYERLAYLLRSSLPICPTPKTKLSEDANNAKRLLEFSGKSFNMMGVDLGLATPYAYAIGKVTINGTAKEVKENSVELLDGGQYPSKSNDNYNRLLKNEQAFVRLVGKSRSFASYNEDGLDISEEEYQNLISDARKHFTKHDVLRGDDKTCLFAKNPDCVLKNFIIKHDNDLSKVKTLRGSLIKVLFRYIKSQFRSLKDDRKMSFKLVGYKTLDGSEFTWLECIERFKRCARSISYLGLGNDREAITFPELNDYYNNCKSNLLKTICSSIAEKANENGCAIVFVENLDVDRSSQSKKENYLTSLWSPKMFQDQLNNALSWYGIQIVGVNENCTSQRESESKKFGYRQGRNFYWEENGDIYQTDADENAARNILYNGATRHYNLYQVNVSNFKKKLLGKRLQGALTVRFGTVSAAKELFENMANSLDNEESSPYFYLHGDTWISQSKRKEIENEIKQSIGD